MIKLIIAAVIFTTAIEQTSFAQTEKKSPFDSVISSYLDLKNALTKDDADSSRLAAQALYSAINEVPMDKLPADQHKIWMQYSEKLSYDSEHIKGTDELEHQREHFRSLSKNMYKLLKAININTVDLYYQYCHMADAYWISESVKVVNPYYGSQMLHCGSVKETLKAATKE